MNLIWFRRDLRVIDNTALRFALEANRPVVAVFIATPEQWGQHHMSPIQADLIYRRLFALRDDLKKLNIPLLYCEVSNYSASVDAITHLANSFDADHIFANKEYEVNEEHRDRLLKSSLLDSQCTLSLFDDKCVFAPGDVLNKQGTYFKVFTPFKKSWLNRFTPPHVTSPHAQEYNLSDMQSELANESNFSELSDSIRFSYSRKNSQAWKVESSDIIRQLRTFCTQHVDQYDVERDFPSLDTTSRLSPYLAIGALSVRQCIARLYMQSQAGVLSTGKQIWLSELIWREFYQHLLSFEPKLSRGHAFVTWSEDIGWHDNLQALQAWQQGKTGFPLVDAAMRQLNQTGWMHNRLRMVVASFLTKDLHLNWREGEAYFMSQLIDGDFAANNGGWQWSASTGCDGQPYFRIFNPVSQSERFDAQGEFIRYWLPELESVPDKWIHQPWMWEGSQMLDYPQPIIDHKVERGVTLAAYKAAKDSSQ
ncbi:deoxyribodipyrimidine photo-lyase [Vibrio sp. 10N.286.49.B3]|uniref:deoxyribodipyrimidine photo-lyase n=1 Tax=Vibrio sp. 10N.286.49.B3 TaxID=1880855 RepID=UPI000C81AD83|nr:deoxyribodipyrimidine photo-lyase [Vibrio sp. 10N.286.49.B3]PMH43149.1 deoxyribodipyrimidine photo-lyase [Vibrio sp. 10N.286.49.B3]